MLAALHQQIETLPAGAAIPGLRPKPEMQGGNQSSTD